MLGRVKGNEWVCGLTQNVKGHFLLGPATLYKSSRLPCSSHLLLQMNVIQAIPEKGNISSEELAEKTGVQEALLIRLFRLLTNSGCVNQNAEGRYSHSHLSLGLCNPGASGMLNEVYTKGTQPLILLPVFFKDQNNETGKSEEPSATIDNTYRNLYTYQPSEHCKSNTFEIMERGPGGMESLFQKAQARDSASPTCGFCD